MEKAVFGRSAEGLCNNLVEAGVTWLVTLQVLGLETRLGTMLLRVMALLP